jgi:protein SCO1/2
VIRAFFSLLLLAAASCTPRKELPVYGQVPRFELVAQSGRKFDSQQLAGKIWVADFIYTTCTGPCPRMTSQMRQIEQAATASPDVRFVSFTVDPERDTPAALAAYAQRFHAGPERWFFLTGDPKTLQMLDRETFKLGNMDASMNHSTRFVLIDRHGRIRGYYGTSEEDPATRVVKDIKRLAGERS